MSIEHPKKKHHSVAEEEHGEGFGDLFVHQLIETIEFVLGISQILIQNGELILIITTLGSVSHTASYLRLWALSLAHSQLAKVFFDKTIKGALEAENPFVVSVFVHTIIENMLPFLKGTIMTLFGFAIFAQVTFGVLLCMDVMECFLHALRLHW